MKTIIFFKKILFCSLFLSYPLFIIAEEECSVLFTLDSAINLALKGNRSLINNYENIERAEMSVEVAEGEFDLDIAPLGQVGYGGGGHAGSGASFSTGVSFTKQFRQGAFIGFEPSVTKMGKHYRTSARVTLIQPLWRGLGREFAESNVYASQFALKSAQKQAYIYQVNLIYRVIAAVYEIVRQKEAFEVHKQSYNRLFIFKNIALRKEKMGGADSLDFYRAEAELKHAEESLNRNKQKLQDAKDALCELLALPLKTNLDVEAPIKSQGFEITQEEAIQCAFKERIEILQAQDQIRETQRLVRIAKNNLLPQVDFNFTYDNFGVDPLLGWECFKHRENSWNASLVSTGGFNELQTNVAYNQSLMSLSTAERNFMQTQDTIVAEIKRTQRALDQSKERIILQQEQIRIAHGELRLSELKMAHGFANNFDLIQAEKNLHAAYMSALNARIDYILSEYQLYLAIGMLADKPKRI